MSSAPVPVWVHKLIDGLVTYDAEHPKLFYETGAAPGERIPAECPCHLLAMVPEQAKRDARMWMEGHRDGYEMAARDSGLHAGNLLKRAAPEGETGQFIERGERG